MIKNKKKTILSPLIPLVFELWNWVMVIKYKLWVKASNEGFFKQARLGSLIKKIQSSGSAQAQAQARL